MKNENFALVGLSGVGKSRLISSIQDDIEFQTLSASNLIKAEKEVGTDHDDLKNHDIKDNQRLLIDGFKRAKANNNQDITVLDGHTIIETPNGLIEISSDVFKEIGIKHFIFLVEDPEIILERRAKDSSRKRSVASLAELVEYQRRALEITTKIALELRVPVTVITSDNVLTLERILSQD